MFTIQARYETKISIEDSGLLACNAASLGMVLDVSKEPTAIIF